MTEAEITELVSTQRNYFKTGETLSVAYRIAALKKLKNTIYFSMKQILMIIQLQSVELSLITKKFVCVVMVKSL